MKKEKKNLTEQIKTRMFTLLDRWKEQTELVNDDFESYLCGYNISRIKISKDVTNMKDTFAIIDKIMKELK